MSIIGVIERLHKQVGEIEADIQKMQGIITNQYSELPTDIN
jgi:hypothetical protein